jgi:hypothetical protein
MAKVYALISSMLLTTFIPILIMYLHKDTIKENQYAFFIPTAILSFVFLFAIFITNGLVKLGMAHIFSGVIGVMMGSSLVYYDATVLLQATLITLNTTIFASLLVFIFKMDLHQWQGILSIGLWICILTSFIFIFFPPSSTVNIIAGIFGIIVFVGYILYDTSELRMTYTFSDDEYILIATNIYLDIINLFLYVLQVLAELQKD